MKPVYILTLGTVSLGLAIAKLAGFPVAWALVLLPIAAPMIYAYVAFIFIIVHALGTGKLEVVAPPKVSSEIPPPPKS